MEETQSTEKLNITLKQVYVCKRLGRLFISAIEAVGNVRVLLFFYFLFFGRSPLLVVTTASSNLGLVKTRQDASFSVLFRWFDVSLFKQRVTAGPIDPHFERPRYVSRFCAQCTETISHEVETRSLPNWDDQVVSVTRSSSYLLLFFAPLIVSIYHFSINKIVWQV